MTDLADAPDDLRERIQAIADKTGFVPNVFVAMLHRPDELRAFMDYHDAIMERESGISKAEREMIVVATSAAWDCPYCVIAHGAIVRLRTKDPLLPDYLSTNYRTADVTPRQRAMLDYAMKVSVAPQALEAPDRAALHAHGFSDDDIWDIAAVAAFFALSNRMAHAADIRPNSEFHTLGR